MTNKRPLNIEEFLGETKTRNVAYAGNCEYRRQVGATKLPIFSGLNTGKIKGLIIKESLQIVRDPSSILIAFILPMMLLFLYGYALSLDTNSINIALVVEEKEDPKIRNLIESFIISDFINVKEIKSNRLEAFPLITSNKVRGIVIIPANFAKDNQKNFETAELQVITDASETNTANFVSSYSSAVWQKWLTLEALDNGINNTPIINVEPRVWYNEELKSRNFIVPNSIALILTLIGTLLTALVVAREWERGTMEALISTPINIKTILLGKAIPYFFLGIGSMLVCTFVALFIFKVPLRGSFLLLLFTGSIYLLSTLGMGLLISTITRDQFAASHLASLTSFLPSFLLSGFIYEINSMPKILQLVTYIVPARYFVSIIRSIFLAGNLWSVILPNICGLIVINIVLFSLTAYKTKKRLD